MRRSGDHRLRDRLGDHRLRDRLGDHRLRPPRLLPDRGIFTSLHKKKNRYTSEQWGLLEKERLGPFLGSGGGALALPSDFGGEGGECVAPDPDASRLEPQVEGAEDPDAHVADGPRRRPDRGRERRGGTAHVRDAPPQF